MANVQTELSFAGAHRGKYREELNRFYANIGFTHALTVSWNRGAGTRFAGSVGVEQARADLKSLHARVDRKLVGKQFHKLADQRTLAVFMLEGVGRNLHCHSLWRLKASQVLPFARLFPDERGGIWNGLVPSGSYKLDIIDDARTVSGYVLKEQHMMSDDRTVLWSDEFVGR